MPAMRAFFGLRRSVMSKEKLLILEEVADILRVNQATVYRMARKGDIPAFKVGRQWRFEKNLITKWLRNSTNNCKKSNGNLKDEIKREIESEVF